MCCEPWTCAGFTSSDMASAATVAGTTPDELCGCVYDKTQESGASFADFNDLITAADMSEVDAGNTAKDAFTGAALDCATEFVTGG